MNRQTRRHPTHPSLPILYPSKTSVLATEGKKAKTEGKKSKNATYKNNNPSER